MSIKTIKLFLSLLLLLNGYCVSQNLYTGFRASRVLNSYPNKVFPSQNYWVNTGKTISGKFSNSTPAGIWIVSLYWDNGEIGMDFPSPGGNVPYITFLGTDYSEPYLSRFDQEGIKIWLQVEPGAADMDTLISLVLNRYKQHPCVTGFGVDVEWFNTQSNSGGRKVTNEEAERWEKKVKSINPNYTLFLKHYSSSWMPPSYRGNIIFVDDSQEFTSFSQMLTYFKSWGSKFYPNPVAFQFGYPKDKTWWGILADPVKDIGSNLISSIPNTVGLFWVDFTITQIFPVSINESKPDVSKNILLQQNYPNPFNPNTIISYNLPYTSLVTLKIFDILGKEIATVVSKEQPAGTYNINWDASNIPNGIYYYQLNFGKNSIIKKMVLQK